NRMSALSATSTGTGRRLRKAPPPTSRQLGSMHWLFRTNIPHRRSSYYQPDIRKRNFFGMGDIIGVLTNPAETVRSLTESKRLLEEARREIHETRERAQLRPKHTFSPLPGFFSRNAELKAIERALEGEPAFTVLFGASSVGKTALLRQVLCDPRYHVLHFDLRISGFADLASLYMSLSQQMEQYFEEIAKQMDGYQDFEKEAWSFKHDRLNVERRLQDAPPESGIQRVKTSDIARLMELFQSSLLKYWKYEPFEDDKQGQDKGDAASSTTRVNQSQDRVRDAHHQHNQHQQQQNGKKKWRFKGLLRTKSKHEPNGGQGSRTNVNGDAQRARSEEDQKEREKPLKKIPVIFFDEAHKLPALIQSTEAMNCLLSSFLVLTKQDRLCHVIHATSDPFYHTWLRQLNVMQHCKIITVGDCSKSEVRRYYRERILPDVPEHLRGGRELEFERLYEAFGGKLVHWVDFIGDYVNSNGSLGIKSSSHFLQAHALLNLHIIHSSQAPGASQSSESDRDRENHDRRGPPPPPPPPPPMGFRIYSPISPSSIPFPSSYATASSSQPNDEGAAGTDFTAIQLLKVMARITQEGVEWLPYFMLCREFGVRAVDGMVRGRVLELRWTEAVGDHERERERDEQEQEEDQVPHVLPRLGGAGVYGAPPDSRPGSVPGYMQNPESPTALLNRDEMFHPSLPPPPPMSPPPPMHNDSEEDIVPVTEREAMMPMTRPPPPPPPHPSHPPPNPYLPNFGMGQGHGRRSTRYQSRYTEDGFGFGGGGGAGGMMEVVGPKLVPITPVMRYAMREVVKEYQEDDDFDGEEGEEDMDDGEGEEYVDLGLRRRLRQRSRSRTGTGTGTDGASEYASLSDVEEY
ncbi:hypothetical protein V5O48_014388, partial [Marasmius crinis-equi]